MCGIHLPEILCKCREEMLYARKSLSDFCVKCIIDSFHAAVLWKCSALSPRAFVRWVLGWSRQWRCYIESRSTWVTKINVWDVKVGGLLYCELSNKKLNADQLMRACSAALLLAKVLALTPLSSFPFQWQRNWHDTLENYMEI